jgi:hypothetical protein
MGPGIVDTVQSSKFKVQSSKCKVTVQSAKLQFKVQSSKMELVSLLVNNIERSQL